MSHRCHHGHLIQDSWMECPECCAEHDAMRAADAAQDAAEEARRQTKILEEIASRRSYESEKEIERESSRTKFAESQELARSAEARFQMQDFRGAVQLITKAIELTPTFVSFYPQRAKYFVCQGKSNQAISDLRHSFEIDNEILIDIENQLEKGTQKEFTSIKSEIKALIDEFMKNAKNKAVLSKYQPETEIKNMLLKFSEKPVPDFVEEAETAFQKLEQLIQSNSYLSLLDIPKFAEEVKNRATKAIKLKNDSENKAHVLLLNAEKKVQEISSPRIKEFAPNELQLAQNTLNEAKQLFKTHSYINYLKCIELSNEAFSEAQKVEEIKNRRLTELRRPFENKLKEKQNDLNNAISSIRNKYYNSIFEQNKIESQNKKKLEKNRSGCALWFLAIVVSIIISIIIDNAFHFNINSPIVAIPLVIGFPCLLYAIFRYTPIIIARSSLSSAEEKIKRLRESLEKETTNMRKKFDNDPEVIELNKKLASFKE